MRMGWVLLLCAAGILGGLWFAARLGFGPFSAVASSVPAPLAALHAHLASNGVSSRVGLVRREHAHVIAKALFNESEHGRVFVVMWCSTDEHARRLASETGGKSTKGPFILYTTDWPRDDDTTRRLYAAFASFDTEAALRPPTR